MKWNQISKDDSLSKYIGRTVENIAVDFESDTLKAITLTLNGELVKITPQWEQLKLLVPATRFKVTGKIKISNLAAEIDAYFFDRLEDAQEKLKDLCEEFEGFTGQIMEVQE